MTKKKRIQMIKMHREFLEDLNEISNLSVNSETGDMQAMDFESMDIPVLPLRNMVLFPNTVLPVSIGRRSSLKLVKSVDGKNRGFLPRSRQYGRTAEVSVPDFCKTLDR